MAKHLKMNDMFLKYVYFFSITLLISSCKSTTQLTIPLLEKEITEDGVINQQEWEQAVVLKNLNAPWGSDKEDKTTFRSFSSSTYFNFYFHVEDDTPVTVPFETELSVVVEDRVELFFSKDTTLTNYYGLEIDMKGKVLDYSAQYYRKFNNDWDFESKTISAKMTDTGYIVEGKILLQELKELGITNPFYLGVFRADFKSHKPNDVTWYSWIKPISLEPDFHIPSAFGKVIIK